MSTPMVVQFGHETMPRWSSSAAALISGITSGTPSWRRQVDDLSMTAAPRCTAAGARDFDSDPVAAKNTTSTPSKAPAAASPTSTESPRNETGPPAERLLASGTRRPTGKRLCSRHASRVSPTAPVAPTTATSTGAHGVR